MMLSLRKLSSQISPCATFTLLPLFLHHHCKAANRTDTTNYESSRHFIQSSSLTNAQTVIITAKSQQIRCPFCTVAEPILVQARDPSRIALELVNAVNERRYEDAWKAYEKHMHMDGLLRKSDLDKLIIGLAESLDAHWLNRACGSVELAFE